MNKNDNLKTKYIEKNKINQIPNELLKNIDDTDLSNYPRRLYKNSQNNLSFGTAIDLLKYKKANKIGCWPSDNTYIYLLENNSLINNKKELRIFWKGKKDHQFFPSSENILEDKWRIIE